MNREPYIKRDEQIVQVSVSASSGHHYVTTVLLNTGRLLAKTEPSYYSRWYDNTPPSKEQYDEMVKKDEERYLAEKKDREEREARRKEADEREREKLVERSVELPKAQAEANARRGLFSNWRWDSIF